MGASEAAPPGMVVAWTAAAVVIAGLVVGFYLRFFSPYVDDAVEYGYIEHIELIAAHCSAHTKA